MASDLDSDCPEACCLPGDITVTKIPAGYLIGRAMDPIGPGPWWEYIAIVRTLDAAQHQALTIARHDGVRAWRHTSGDDYDLIEPES
jgi:hypothetical protein